MSTSNQPMDWIHLKRFSFPCVLGIFDWEQKKPQTLAIEISMGLDLTGAADGTLARSVNYAATLEQARFIAQHGRWRMLESMATAMARLLLAPPAAGEERAQVSRAVVRLSKPDVFEGRAEPGIELHRDSAWCASTLSATSAGGARVEVLQESIESGAYRLHLEPGATWSSPAGMKSLVIVGPAATEGAAIEATGAAAVCVLVVGERPRSAWGVPS